jgi:glyoxylase-like metal-dependent hydrolase (beta-lactamase superfamily II)
MGPEPAPDLRGDDRPAVPIADEVWAVRLPLDGPFPPYTLTYLLRAADGGVHVIDPGINRDANMERFQRALDAIGSTPAQLKTITSTHLHRDHTGLGLRLREHYGIPLALHAEEQRTLDSWRGGPPVVDLSGWGVPADIAQELDGLPVGDRRVSFEADRLLRNDDVLAFPGFRLRVIYTPGHTSGHIALHESERDLLFTGDHLVPDFYPGIGLSGDAVDPLGDYLGSLDALSGLGEPQVLPGHSYPFRGLQQRVVETRDHHARRTDEVAAILDDLPEATVWEVASRVGWTDGWDGLSPRYRLNALRQTAMRIRRLERQG